MGKIGSAVMNGDVCECCMANLGEGDGYSRICEYCQTECPACGEVQISQVQ